MNFLGLNSPAIFIISVIVLTILGPKRIEKGWFLFQRVLKFLLSKEDDFSKYKSEETEVKEEVLDAKLEESEETEVKEEVLDAKLEEAEETEVKEEVAKADIKEKTPKSKKTNRTKVNKDK